MRAGELRAVEFRVVAETESLYKKRVLRGFKEKLEKAWIMNMKTKRS